MDATQKEVHRTAQMMFGLIAIAQTAAQQAVQSQGINSGLHVITVLGHRRVQTLGAVGRIVLAQSVGLVVEHPITALVLKHQVDKAHQHAVQGAALQTRARHARQEIFLAQLVELPDRQALCGQPKLHLRAHGLQVGQGHT